MRHNYKIATIYKCFLYMYKIISITYYVWHMDNSYQACQRRPKMGKNPGLLKIYLFISMLNENVLNTNLKKSNFPHIAPIWPNVLPTLTALTRLRRHLDKDKNTQSDWDDFISRVGEWVLIVRNELMSREEVLLMCFRGLLSCKQALTFVKLDLFI